MTTTASRHRRSPSWLRWRDVDSTGALAWAGLGVVAVAAISVWALAQLGWLLLPVAIAVIFGVIASPIVTTLERRGVPRTLATVIVFVGLFVIGAGLAVLIVPPFVTQLAKLSTGIPEFLDRAAKAIRTFENRAQVTNPATAELLTQAESALRQSADGFAESLSSSVFDVVGLTGSVLAAAVIGVVLAFLAVVDLPRFSRPVRPWLDRPGHERLAGVLEQMRRTSTGFIRGQMLKALVVWGLSAAAFAIAGVPYPIPLGVLTAVGTFIPSFGPLLAGIPAIVISLATGGTGLAVACLVAIFAVQMIEDYVLVPKIVGNAVEIPPLVVIVSLTIAAGFFGVIGLVLIVPAVAVARDLVRWMFMTDTEVHANLSALRAPPDEGADVKEKKKGRHRRLRRRRRPAPEE